MKLKNSRWTMVILGVIALLMVGTMVWASPRTAPWTVPIDAQNADRVDNHHAGPSSGTKGQRANRVLWATSGGRLHWRAMPQGELNQRYLNDDRQETISAAVTDGAVLSAANTAPGSESTGLAASSADGRAVWGDSDTGIGVVGSSTSGFGMYAIGAGDGTATDRIGDLLVAGDRGEIHSLGNFLNLFSDNRIQFFLDNNNDNANSQFSVWNGTYGVVWLVDEGGNTWASGTKGAMVQTKSHGERGLYAMESPEVWFEDFGQAQLVDGQAVVAIEPIFAQTVNLSETYHVFLTPFGDEPVLLFVTEKRRSGFTVRGVTLDGEPAAGSFDYRIIGKRLGYEEKRLDPAEDPNQLIQEME